MYLEIELMGHRTDICLTSVDATNTCPKPIWMNKAQQQCMSSSFSITLLTFDTVSHFLLNFFLMICFLSHHLLKENHLGRSMHYGKEYSAVKSWKLLQGCSGDSGFWVLFLSSKILNNPAVSLWDFHSWDALVPSLGTTNMAVSLRFIVWAIS